MSSDAQFHEKRSYMKHYRQVPPTASLRGFEATVRLGSVTLAAAELGLTQSAVSHQLKLLEAHTGQPLFLRAGRDLRVSDAGRDYYRSVRDALDRLEEGLKRLEPYRKANSVVVYAPGEFIQYCLIPALPDLARAHPEIDPWLASNPGAVDFDNMEIDIAILRAEAAPAGLRAHGLGQDRLTPIASPLLTVRRPADVLRHPLIHDERRERWTDWLALAGMTDPAPLAGLNVSDSGHALCAAEHGRGITLASSLLAASAIAAKRLIAPFALALPCREHWYALTQEQRLADAATRRMWDWLTSPGRFLEP
jgi:LysR family transcriptional regulator, glycine cleavage system transcriptional activator